MCGIAGLFGHSDFESPQMAQELSGGLAARGPDDAGNFKDPASKTLLVHRRLSILDLTHSAHQPMTDDTGKFTIVYNGEVYNFAEIKTELESLGVCFKSHSDTEVILYAYIKWGEKCLEKFRGMFAFAILDKSKDKPTLFIARDRFGIKPLLFSFTNDGFVFSSELKALTASKLIDKKIRPNSMFEFFCMGSVMQPSSIYQNVFQLEPGTCAIINSSLEIKTTKWYDLPTASSGLIQEYVAKPYDELVSLTRSKLEEAAKYHAVADVDVGVFLSGGIDSSAVAGLHNLHHTGKLKAFSIGFDSQNEVVDELEGAAESAAFLGAEHHVLRVDDQHAMSSFDSFTSSIDQPSIDGFNTFLVSQFAASEIKVVLSGLGGDELLAGYPHFNQIASNYKKSDYLLSNLFSMIHSLRPNRISREFLYRGKQPADALRVFREYIPQGAASGMLSAQLQNTIENIVYEKIAESEFPLRDISKAEISGYLLSTLLRDCDVCSMAHSLEVRPILLDHHFVEHAYALPDSAKIVNDKGKAVLVDAVQDLIAPGCMQRKKSGFEMPYGRWLSGGLQSKYQDLLSSASARDLFSQNEITRLQSIKSGSVGARQAWRWLILLDWYHKSGASI